MRQASVWFLAPILALSSLTFACGDDDGGGDDGGDKTPNAGSSGSEGSNGTGGKGGTGSGNGNGNGNGTVTGSTKLSDIDTAAEADAACARARASVDLDELEAFVEGSCVLSGLLSEALGGPDCETAKAECLAEDNSTDYSDCTAEEIPDCDATLDEYIACAAASAKAGAALYKNLTCSTDLESLSSDLPETPAACAPVYEKCPELASGAGEET